MRKRNWFRNIAASTALAIAGLLIASAVQAAVPYEGYTYDGWGERVPSPVAYIPLGTVTGESLGIGKFNLPEDVFVSEEQKVYITDTGNNRIVIMDKNYQLVKVLDKFSYEGNEETFKTPNGVFVTKENVIYVADTGNHRVVRLTEDGKADQIITAPKNEFFAADFIFEPRKLGVDSADRLYVIANHVFDGIMQFDDDGIFQNYYAANRVKYSVADYVWKKYLSTSEQRERMVMFIPTEYLNLDLDDKGFVFTTSVDDTGVTPTPIKRHNPTGTDVLIRQGFASPIGDLEYGLIGPSRLVDIDVGTDGKYSVLDRNRGRIFTYDSEGKLLYIFGGLGDRVGRFNHVTALERVGDSMVVLDKNWARLTLFGPTYFGKLVNEAVHYHYIGNEVKASERWREVLTLDANFDLAYSGVSKSMLRAGDNQNAVEYAKFGMDRKSFSKAYQRFRKEVLKDHFDSILTILLILSIGSTVYVQVRKFQRRKGGEAHERTH